MADASAVDFVLDASALSKLLFDESESQAFRAWWINQITVGARFAAPDLLGYEMAHVVARSLPPTKDPGAFRRTLRILMEGIALHSTYEHVGPYVRELSAYDASYVAAAVELDTVLVSYDGPQQGVARRRGVVVESPAGPKPS